ncbi:MAG: hypothetical protein IJO29_01835 [Oscillospiraceae bacterium]|nr:hypothetical protein [Oscillospiraceae bacterium]
MIKKKKIILSVIAACTALAIIIIVIILNMPAYRLQLKPDDIPVTISVYSEQSVLDSFFSPGFMGQSYDYEIVVKENGLFGSTLMRRSFTFSSDGAPIHEYDISVDSENETVIIKISGSEMQDKVFEVQLD